MSYLGLMYLGLEEHDQALAISAQSLKLFAEHKKVPGEEQAIYYNHYQILKALGDDSAKTYLKEAYDIMQEQAGLIHEDIDRASYLEHVKLNRRIAAEMYQSSLGV